MRTTFPKDFLWGAATAAHQVEGNNINSDFWLLERMPETLFAEPSGDTIDHYHRYREDIALLAKLGFNSYRFSIEWARVEPEEGYFSDAVINHYRRMLEVCHEHNLKPMVTFHHFTSPRWLISKGGWENEDTAGRFARYCSEITKRLGDLMDKACTINEVNIPVVINRVHLRGIDLQELGFMQAAKPLLGISPSDKLNTFMFTPSPKGREVILEAHRQATSAIKSVKPAMPVGMTISMDDLQAVDGGEVIRDQIRHELQDVYLEAAREDDFLGVQTYTRARIGPEGKLEPEAGIELTQMGFEFWPRALEATLRYANEVANVPLTVTENGIATSDDARRTEYYEQALAGVANCLDDGLDIRGYYAWSAFDNFEWMLGYEPKFGLVEIDRSNQERIVRQSGRRLGEIARANCIP